MRHTNRSGWQAWAVLVLLAGVNACAEETKPGTPAPKDEKAMGSAKTEYATFGQGCFWCAEAIFQRLPGVVKVESGYCNGKTENPTYKQVCSGETGHAEVVRVEYDPVRISYEKLLDTFFTTHDPTTLNRQGNDAGTQYRSGIYYHSDEQKKTAEAAKEKWNKSGRFKNPIVTEIEKAATFYKAEDYHQNYFNLNPDQGYCRVIIAPKVEKFEKDLKKDGK